LVVWESYVIPSCKATHFFIAIQIRVNPNPDGLGHR
jgi:hypothetical protein